MPKATGGKPYQSLTTAAEMAAVTPTLANLGLGSKDRAKKLSARAQRLLGELLEGMPKATGTRGQFRGSTDGSGAAILEGPEIGASVLVGPSNGPGARPAKTAGHPPPTLTDLGLGSKSRGYLTSRRDNSDSRYSRAPGIRSILASSRLTVLCKRSLSAARCPTWPSPLMMSWRIASDRDFAGVLFFACRFIRPPAPPDFAQRSIAASSSGEMRTGITGSRPIGSRPVGMGSTQIGFVMAAEWQKRPRCGITKSRTDNDAVIEEKRLRGQAR